MFLYFCLFLNNFDICGLCVKGMVVDCSVFLNFIMDVVVMMICVFFFLGFFELNKNMVLVICKKLEIIFDM